MVAMLALTNAFALSNVGATFHRGEPKSDTSSKAVVHLDPSMQVLLAICHRHIRHTRHRHDCTIVPLSLADCLGM